MRALSGFQGRSHGVIAVALWILSGPAAAQPLAPAQEPKVSIAPDSRLRTRPPAPRANLRLDVSMVVVPVTVTDAADRPVEHLTPQSFRVFEDDVEQQIVGLALEEGPVSVGFIFDSSSSMKNRMEPSIQAIRQFLKTLLPEDEFFLIRFADTPKVLTGFTRDPDEILSKLGSVQPAGWTALHDAICLGVQRLKSAKNPRRALFVLTDGGDNNSRYSAMEVRNLLRESDVRVYSIGLFENPGLLEKIAADTGGRAYSVHHLDELPDTVERLSRELRSQYMLSYYSHDGVRDGKYRKVKVELLEALRHLPLNVFWRRGYFAPPD